MILSGIKKLAGQTLWYGVPTIAYRFLGYIMNMALPFFIDLPEDTADLVQVYAMIPFLNALYAYGMETAYFKFSQSHDKSTLYSTLSISLFSTTIFFSILLLFLKGDITSIAHLNNHPEYVLWMIGILAIDNLNTLPFAKLRQENRPKMYAFARVAAIFTNIGVVVFFLVIVPAFLKSHPQSFIANYYNPHFGIGYYLVGNIIENIVTLVILQKELRQIKFKFSYPLWKEVIKYSAPLIIVGLGGMTNDVLSRLIYRHVVDLPEQQANHEAGIFANIFRLALLTTIMIQAFRMAAEPFFFNQSKNENAQRTYARVMKFFVIACCYMFLFIALFIDFFKWFFATFANKNWVEGFGAIPILALGNVFLGIYYNLSIWYKLTNKNTYGAIITIVGAIITIVLNIILIPVLHYYGAAIATFSCYLFMMVCSYSLGQKHYTVPYNVRKILGYISLVVLLYLIQLTLTYFIKDVLWFSISSGILLLLIFTRFVGKTESKDLAALPFLNKFYRKR